jgi:hypothetical protein
MSHDRGPFTTNDYMNLAVATTSYLGATLLIKNHTLTDAERLFSHYTDIVEADAVSYLMAPFLFAFTAGIGIESALKPDSPFAVHATSGLLVFFATILTAFNVASPLTLDVSNVFSAGAAGAGMTSGRYVRYLAREKNW